MSDGKGMGAGPFIGHELDNPTARRAAALQMAIETMRLVREFTNYQVVHVASLYDRFLESGTTPPAPVPPVSTDD